MASLAVKEMLCALKMQTTGMLACLASAELAVLAPIIAAVASPLMASVPRIGSTLAKASCLAAAYLTFAALLALTLKVSDGPLRGTLFELSLSSESLMLELYVDYLALLPALLTSFIGALALTYSLHYLSPANRAYDVRGGFDRSHMFITLFIGSMVGALFSDNILGLLIFWELTTLCSYALITYRLDKPEALRAGLKCLLMTHLGGVCLLGAALVLHSSTGTLRISEYGYSTAPLGPWALAALLLLVIGVLPKAVQYPLHTWLPDGVVAPTPATVLFHVCGFQLGVYVLIRFLWRLLSSPGGAWSFAITSLGAVTLLVGALAGLVSRNLKRIIAYGTISGLGYMVMGVGLMTPLGLAAALLLMASHALCYSLLFFCAGAVMYATGEDDIERLGGCYHDMRVTATCCFIACLSLAAMPLTLEYVGKYAILQAVVDAGYLHLFPIGVFGCLLNAALGARLFYTVFLGQPRGRPAANDPPLLMIIPMLITSGLIVVLGTFPSVLLNNLVLPSLLQLGAGVKALELLSNISRSLPALATAVAALALALLLILYRLSEEEVKHEGVEEVDEVVKPFLCGEDLGYVDSKRGRRFYHPLFRGVRLDSLVRVADPDRLYMALARSFSRACKGALKLDIRGGYGPSLLSFAAGVLILVVAGVLLWYLR